MDLEEFVRKDLHKPIGIALMLLSYIVILAGGCCQSEGFFGSILAVPSHIQQDFGPFIPFIAVTAILFAVGSVLLGLKDCRSVAVKAIIAVTPSKVAAVKRKQKVVTVEVDDVGNETVVDPALDTMTENFRKTNNALLHNVLNSATPL